MPRTTDAPPRSYSYDLGLRDPGECRTRPRPNARNNVEAALGLFRNHVTMYRRTIAEAEVSIEMLRSRISSASDNLDWYDEQIAALEARWPDLAKAAE